jgi:pimeloyl-ACP methyl ester carboxylesterase
MQQAGVGPDDPVMLVGFSQGGIMAGHLAAYNSDYNWDAVVVAGAPIDSMPIPSSTTVVSVQHDGDLVPRLDSVISSARRICAAAAELDDINSPSPLAFQGVGGIHNAAAYNSTLQSQIDRVPPATQDDLNAYFIGDDDTYGYDTTYYSWQEK